MLVNNKNHEIINYSVSLLILDDFGLAPMYHNTKLALLQILKDRYAKKSVTIALSCRLESGTNILPNLPWRMPSWTGF